MPAGCFLIATGDDLPLDGTELATRRCFFRGELYCCCGSDGIRARSISGESHSVRSMTVTVLGGGGLEEREGEEKGEEVVDRE